jgi:hypothetical protein
MGQGVSLLCETGGTVRGPPTQAQDYGKNAKFWPNLYWFIVTALTCTTTYFPMHFLKKCFLFGVNVIYTSWGQSNVNTAVCYCYQEGSEPVLHFSCCGLPRKQCCQVGSAAKAGQVG